MTGLTRSPWLYRLSLLMKQSDSSPVTGVAVAGAVAEMAEQRNVPWRRVTTRKVFHRQTRVGTQSGWCRICQNSLSKQQFV